MIASCSRKEIKGGHGQWITIDTNHMAFVFAEVEEFELTVMTPAAKQFCFVWHPWLGENG